MANSYYLVYFLVILMMISALAASARTSGKKEPGEYFDDSAIAAQIRAWLAEDDLLKAFQIRVEARNGVVKLSGFVDSRKVADKASEIVRGIKGVKSVRNKLVVR
jgi:osmotically-inducible protein OsmY